MSGAQPEVDPATGELLPAETEIADVARALSGKPGTVVVAAPRPDAMQAFGDEIGMERARAVANQLDALIREKKLFVRMGQSDHIKVEAWCACASMVGLSPKTAWTQEIREDGFGLVGFRARVEVIRLSTVEVIGAAEASCWAYELQKTNSGFLHRWCDFCERHETATDRCPAPVTWHSVESMAQTRATSKSLGQILRFIPVIAGYSGTPAEEMGNRGGDPPPQQSRQPEQRDHQAGERKVSIDQVGRLWAIAYHRGESCGTDRKNVEGKVRKALDARGFTSTKDLTKVPYDAIVGIIETLTIVDFPADPS